MSTHEKLRQEIDRYLADTPVSRQKQADAEKYLPGGSSRGTAYFAPHPHFIERGEGHYIHDVDGNRLLDFMINATSLVLGHAHPDVTRAIQEQAVRGTAFTGPTDPQVRMAKILTERVPSLDLVRFTNSGTEGTMMAIRAARAFTGREKIAKFEGGYHGAHEYVSVSVRPPLEKLDPSGPTPIPEYSGMPQSILDQVIVLPYNDLDWCERVLRSNADDIACLIMEPVVSSFGYLAGDIEFLRGLRELTSELGIVLIYDEVQSFRIAPGGAQETLGVIPDMTALGKIIGGGTPVGAFGGRADIMELFDPTRPGAIPHAGTFNANPVTMAAGEAVMNHLTPEVYDHMNALGGQAQGQAAGSVRRVRDAGAGNGHRFAVRHPLHVRGDQGLSDSRPLGPDDGPGAVHRPAERGRTAPDRDSGRSERADHRGRSGHSRGRHTAGYPENTLAKAADNVLVERRSRGRTDLP